MPPIHCLLHRDQGASLYSPLALLEAELCAGSGGSSLTSMAERTLGTAGALLVTGCYFFLHYAMLVACEWCAPPHPLSLELAESMVDMRKSN